MPAPVVPIVAVHPLHPCFSPIRSGLSNPRCPQRALPSDLPALPVSKRAHLTSPLFPGPGQRKLTGTIQKEQDKRHHGHKGKENGKYDQGSDHLLHVIELNRCQCDEAEPHPPSHICARNRPEGNHRYPFFVEPSE